MSSDAASISDTVVTVDGVMRGRFANRFYLDRPVDPATDIIEVSRYAGTGANVQPWHVHVVSGLAKARLIEALEVAHETEPAAHTSEYTYLISDLSEPYASRRKEFGAVFYGALGITSDDHAARAMQTARNLRFFDAPVGLIFTIDRRLEKGSWLDLGMFIQNVMLAARARGLDTCPQEFFSRYHAVIRRELSLRPEEMVVCGMSMGFGDPEWAKCRPHKSTNRRHRIALRILTIFGEPQ
ncbi:nitroreductase [Pararhizobium sp. DWP1-1-3]|uniref:nitroreductase n=1 Tax=Pararhizobium sp. DWP1-1-3 TaxID=2804652 RepID=UPI003CF6D0FB